MGAADSLHACFGESEVLHFALLDEVFHGPRCVFDGDIGVDTMLIEKIDDVGLEALERCLGDFFDVIGAAVCAHTLSRSRVDLESELGRDDHLFADRNQRFANEFFIHIRAVNFSGVEKRNAEFDRLADERNAFLFANGLTEAETHTHAAEADGGDFQVAFTKFAFLHEGSVVRGLGECLSISGSFLPDSTSPPPLAVRRDRMCLQPRFCEGPA